MTDQERYLSAPLAMVAARDAATRAKAQDHSGEATLHHAVHRIREIRSREAGARTRMEERKLASHVTLITIGAMLSLICTSGMFLVFHIDVVIPLIPNGYMMELWDWVWRQ